MQAVLHSRLSDLARLQQESYSNVESVRPSLVMLIVPPSSSGLRLMLSSPRPAVAFVSASHRQRPTHHRIPHQPNETLTM